MPSTSGRGPARTGLFDFRTGAVHADENFATTGAVGMDRGGITPLRVHGSVGASSASRPPSPDTDRVSIRVKEAMLIPTEGRGPQDIFSLACGVVTAQLRLLLAEHEVRLRASVVHVRVETTRNQDSIVELLLFDDLQEGGDAGVVTVPSSIAELPPVRQWWLAFTVMRRACEGFAALAGESPAAWNQIADELLARGPAQRVNSTWKASPDRRHRARAVVQLRADHAPEAWVEITRRGADEAEGRGATVHAMMPIADRQLQPPTWVTSSSATTAVLVDRGWLCLDAKEVSAEIDGLLPVEPLAGEALAAAPRLPDVTVKHFSTKDATLPARVEFGGISGEPHLVTDAEKAAWWAVGAEQLPGLELWWQDSGLATLYIHAVNSSCSSRSSSSMDGRDLWVWVELLPHLRAADNPRAGVLSAIQEAVKIAARRAKMPALKLTT